MTMQGEPAPQRAPVPQAPAKRPGGLTALAVLNFVFGGIGLITSLMSLAVLNMADDMVKIGTAGQASITDAPGAGTVYANVFLGIIAAVLLIAAGVGYIGQKKVLGYMVGCAYGILGIVGAIVNMATMPGSVVPIIILGLAYPIITLALLNTTFKKCFVN